MKNLKHHPALVYFALLVASLQHASATNRVLAAPPAAEGQAHEELSREILGLFQQDQKHLRDFEAAKNDEAFARAYGEWKARVLKTHPAVFYDLATKELWASEPDAPESLREMVAWRSKATDRVKAIIAEHGWPRRAAVGDEAAGAFFFLFGHVDTSNKWRRTQLETVRKVFEEDRINPRLYAHICDRIESVDDKPQVFGTVMGPGDDEGSAKLYRPVVDNLESVDKRRADIGLPPMEDDLEKFRRGAKIGPYMTPLTKEWKMADIYGSP